MLSNSSTLFFKNKTLLIMQLFKNLRSSNKLNSNFRRFWEAVRNLKTLPQKEVKERVKEVWSEFLCPDATCPINVDSKSYEITKKNLENPDRWCFDVAGVSAFTYL